jgi:hypothetical protein
MLGTIVLVSILVSGLSGHGSTLLLAADVPSFVRNVTKAASADEIEFVSFEFQEPAPMHVSVSLYRIEGEPVSGARYPVDANIGGEEAIATASFEVIAEDGTVLQPLPIALRGAGVPGSFDFIGLMTVPSQPFRVVLSGQGVDGRPFRRVYERLFRPLTRRVERRLPRDLPPEYAAEFQRQVDEQGPRLIAEAEAYVAAHATLPIVMPRVEISKAMYAPLLSPAGHPIGVRVTYDVEFSLAGRYNPEMRVHPEYLDDSTLGGSDQMRVLDSRLQPLPRQAHAPHAPAGTSDRPSVLAYGADFLYEARTVYHFTVELVPSFINPIGRSTKPCVAHQRLHTAKAQATFAKRLSTDGPTTYRVYIGGEAYEGRIDNFLAEGTIYRNFVTEAVQECPQRVM